MKTLSAASAAQLDEHLMSTCAFSIDQLMELAGLSVAQAVHRQLMVARRQRKIGSEHTYSPQRILIVCGPGNNGGDGLVAARHLALMSYKPVIWYPKPSFGKAEIYQRLVTQLRSMNVETHVGPEEATADGFMEQVRTANLVVDAIFGFSFKPGPKGEIRAPFDKILEEMVCSGPETLSVDIPSGWDVDNGRPEGEEAGIAGKFLPAAVISLTAPKKWLEHSESQGWHGSHYIGGRFLSEEVAKKFDIALIPYEGIEQVIEVDKDGNKVAYP